VSHKKETGGRPVAVVPAGLDERRQADDGDDDAVYVWIRKETLKMCSKIAHHTSNPTF
jgi:hypothetical protein